MKKLTINSDQTYKNAMQYISDMWQDKKYITVTLSVGKKRSISQNSISHAWYAQVAREESEYTQEHVKCLCKLHIGLPILRGDDEEYNDYCVKFIDMLTYEDKVDAMKYFPCTSLMKTKQLAEYLEQVQKHYVGRVKLDFPEDNYVTYGRKL